MNIKHYLITASVMTGTLLSPSLVTAASCGVTAAFDSAGQAVTITSSGTNPVIYAAADASQLIINATGANYNSYSTCDSFDFIGVKDSLNKITLQGSLDEIRAALIIYGGRIQTYSSGNTLTHQIELVLIPNDHTVTIIPDDVSFIHNYLAGIPALDGHDPKTTIHASGNVDLSAITTLPASDALVVTGSGTITIPPSISNPQTYFNGQVTTSLSTNITNGANTWTAQQAGTATPAPAPSPSGGGGYSAPAPATPSGCGDNQPAGVADLFQIDRQGTSATLYFTPVNDHTSRYHLVFGHQVGEELYGQLSAEVTRDTNNGVQIVTVNNLNAKQAYSFQVMPVNGCAVGERSNWLTSPKLGTTYRYH